MSIRGGLYRVVGAAVFLMLGLTLPAVSEEGATAPVQLSRDSAYWRGAQEESPGPFLCVKPAATDVTVVCDRWPDCSDLRQFGLDAIRLSGAKTDHEKCLAVWRWVRRCTMCTNGTPPIENFQNPKQSPFAGGYLLEPSKILNVYGAHWCAGLSQTVENVWRALGYQSQKVNFHGHTVVDCYYRDYDGIERWHVMDVDSGGYVLDRTNQRLLTLDELNYDFFTDWMFGWLHGQHLAMPTHRVDLALRPGESLLRAWSNWNLPYENNVGKMAQWVGGNREGGASVEKIEHGPYPYAFGNGRWTYKPDLSNAAEWMNGLAEKPTGLMDARGTLKPAQVGVPATLVWRFRTPYIVSDAEVHLKLDRKSVADLVRLHLSVDDGATWKPLWEAPADAVGAKDLVVPICQKFAFTQPEGKKRKVFAPPEGFNSPFGRYHYRLKLELVAKDAPADCRIDGIEFVTTVQQNYYSLPQLQPGKNQITVKGDLAQGAALKVTYIWDDPAGKDRRNVTVVEKAPFTYEIIAGGGKWEDCVCKSIAIEAVPASGKGNRTEVKETPADFAAVLPMPPVDDTRECMLIRPAHVKLPPAEQLIKDLETPEKTLSALYGLVELREPKAFEAIKKIVYQVQPPSEWKDPMMGVKELSLAALYAAGGEKAKPVLLDVLSEPTHSKWITNKGFNGTWIGGAAVIGYIAAEAGWKDFVPALAKALDTPNCHEEAANGLLRSLGRLGDPRAAAAIRSYLGDGMNLDTVYVAALAAGQVGDHESIGQLRKYLVCDYPPANLSSAKSLGMLGDKASAPILRKWLTRVDEDFRGVAAEALAALGDKDSIQSLEAALAAEPFPWVRDEITKALGKLKR